MARTPFQAASCNSLSCRPQATVTSHVVAAAARAMGADPTTAARVAFAIDIAVPIAAGFAGATRVVAVRRGTISLATEEALGGHAIARHVGRTEEQLRLRLMQEPRLRAASTFHTLQDAERAVAATLRANKAAIKSWAATAGPNRTKPFFYTSANIVGHGVVRSTGKLTDMRNVVVVLKKIVSHNRVYFVLTAHPDV
jgi:hypothetical protein